MARYIHAHTRTTTHTHIHTHTYTHTHTLTVTHTGSSDQMMMRHLMLHNNVFKDGHEDRYTCDQLYLGKEQQGHHDVRLVGSVGEGVCRW